MPERSEGKYTHGYSDAAAVEMVNRRAESHAAFFLPYLARLGENSRVLDCGCGPGSITTDFARLLPTGSVVGIDIDSEQVEMATWRTSVGTRSNLEYQQADLHEIPFANDTFDAVFANAVLEHVQEPLVVMKEMFRVLKPGGLVALRHSVVSSRTWSPPAPPEVQSAEVMWVEQWRRNGGDPDFGLKQQEMMTNVGFEIVSASESVHLLDWDRLYVRTGLGGEAGFMTTLREIGVPRSDVPRTIRAFAEWHLDANVSISMRMVETVGRK